MPRRSPFTIRLTEQERVELEARCKEYTSPYRDVMRAKQSRLTVAPLRYGRWPQGKRCSRVWQLACRVLVFDRL
jgi:hypothetical protein